MLRCDLRVVKAFLDPNWRYLAVTGISSCRDTGSGLERLLRVRDSGDITPL